MEDRGKPVIFRGKMIAGGVCTLLTVAVLLSAFTGGGRDGGAQATESVYRENTVERGDITVGVTETATATLKTHAVTFDVSLSSRDNNNELKIGIDEIYVKAGQTVREGDPLVLMSAADMEEELSELQADYQEAVVALNQAELSRQKGELEARTSYNSTLSKSEYADVEMEMTVDELEAAVAKANKTVEELQAEIRTYTKLLNAMDGYEEDYDRYIDTDKVYGDAQEWLSSAQSLLRSHLNTYHGGSENMPCTSEDACDLARLQANVEEAEAEAAWAKLEYEDASSTYTKRYSTTLTDEDDIKDARRDALDQLEEAEAALKKAQYNLELQTASAGLTHDSTLAQAEIAESTYQLELLQLQNNVESKSLAANNIQEQITKLSGYLENNLLTAPCDGIVTAVSYDAGDTVASGASIVTVSDSSNVFVYITVSQDDITGISLGQSATLVMDAFDELPFDGEVDSISTSPVRSANGSASYTVTVRVLGDTAQIYEGMTGTVTLITRQQKDVLNISNRAVYTEGGVSYVKVKEGDEIRPVEVETGFSDGRNVEIVSGLEEGMTYIIESQVVSGQ